MYNYMNFVFFKQKTAYEMRISDWSSDVCSSDLGSCASQDRGRSTLCASFNLTIVTGFTGKPVVKYLACKLNTKPISRTRLTPVRQIGRASRRERVCQYV